MLAQPSASGAEAESSWKSEASQASQGLEWKPRKGERREQGEKEGMKMRLLKNISKNEICHWTSKTNFQ